jgi:hypothetical protein
MPDRPVIFASELIVVQDVASELPRHRNWPWNHSRSARYRLIDGREVDRVYWHHTAGRIPRGVKGPMATASFCVADPDPENPRHGGRGWPGMPYHLFIPFVPETTPAGQIVVYQCQPFDMASWHTGGKDERGRGRNRYGVGVVCQGCFWSRHDPKRKPLPGQTGRPSTAQLVASHALWTGYLKPRLGLTNRQLSGHFEAGKPTCPGDVLEAWVKQVQQQADAEAEGDIRGPA